MGCLYDNLRQAIERAASPMRGNRHLLKVECDPFVHPAFTSAVLYNDRYSILAGENTVAVVVQNGAGEGGVNKGVTLDLEQMPVAAHWRRSAFNGLAQVIVQTTHQPGRITLTEIGGASCRER